MLLKDVMETMRMARLLSKATQKKYHGPSIVRMCMVGGKRRMSAVATIAALRLRMVQMTILRLLSILTLEIRMMGIEMTVVFCELLREKWSVGDILIRSVAISRVPETRFQVPPFLFMSGMVHCTKELISDVWFRERTTYIKCRVQSHGIDTVQSDKKRIGMER